MKPRTNNFLLSIPYHPRWIFLNLVLVFFFLNKNGFVWKKIIRFCELLEGILPFKTVCLLTWLSLILKTIWTWVVPQINIVKIIHSKTFTTHSTFHIPRVTHRVIALTLLPSNLFEPYQSKTLAESSQRETSRVDGCTAGELYQYTSTNNA